jgi:hypothetical protein
MTIPAAGFPAAGHPVTPQIAGNLTVFDPTNTGKFGILTAAQINGGAINGVIGQTYSPLAFGAKGDGVAPDDTAIAKAIAAIPSAGGILDLSGAVVAYGITQPIQLPSGCAVIGTFINNQDISTGPIKTDIACLSTFSGLACIADAGALGTGARPGASLPVSIRGLSIDMSNVPAGQAPDGIRLMTFRSNVEYCFIRGSAHSGSGIHFTDANAGGNVISGSAVENAARHNWITRMAGSGIIVDRTTSTAKLTDGFVCGNLVEMAAVAVASAYNSTGAAIDVEAGANWQVTGNHVYRCPSHAIIVNHAFTSFILSNKVDNFGLAGAASTSYRGIWVNNANGPATVVASNEVDGDESHGQVTTNYYYYETDAARGFAATVTMTGNSARKAKNNPSSGGSAALNAAAAGTGTSLALADWGTTSLATGTAIPPAAAVNTTGNVSLLRGPLPSSGFYAPAQPTGTASTTVAAAGLGSVCVFTPSLTGKVRIRIAGVAGSSGTTEVTVTVSGYYGTGTAPANGGSLTGATQFAQGNVPIHAHAITAAGLTGFMLEHQATGLALGTEIWVDVGFFTATSSGPAEIANITVTIEEIN